MFTYYFLLSGSMDASFQVFPLAFTTKAGAMVIVTDMLIIDHLISVSLTYRIYA